MGTSGAYSGSGGKTGDKLRNDIGDWINALPGGGGPPPGPPPDTQPPDGQPPNTPPDSEQPNTPNRPRLHPDLLRPIVQFFRPRATGAGRGDGPGAGGGGNGSGGGRRGGGPTRTAATSSRTAGRAAAAAYAYRTGDTDTLERLGLNYAELSSLGDPFEIMRRIVDAACGGANSTMEDHEQRLVAADVAEWVLTENTGRGPTPDEIVRHTIALIIAETVLSETGEVVSNSNHADIAEQEIRDAADALAAREEFSTDGVSETEFADAIERGIETLRSIVEGSD